MKPTLSLNRPILTLCLYLVLNNLQAQESEKVLFIGNSYTAYNDLPYMVAQVALSVGDTLLYDSHTPDGETFSGHASTDTVFALISQGDWDHVVLQGQSQEPSFPLSVALASTFPAAQKLCDSVHSANPCAKAMLYMTWGRRDGDAGNCINWPPVCTYEGMDDLLRERYQLMAEVNQAYVSPVGAVWRHMRDNGTEIELFANDGSNPSLAGSYAAACSFYTVIFEKDPLLISDEMGLSATDALEIREAVHAVAYNDLAHWNIGEFDPLASLTEHWLSDFTYQFIDLSEHADSIEWFFNEEGVPGDTLTYTFPGPGTYTVPLVAQRCGISDTLEFEIFVNPIGLEEHGIISVNTFPNPASDLLFMDDEWAESSYQIHDAVGRMILDKQRYTRTGIDIRALDDGMYYLSISNKDGHFGLSQFLVMR